jgi:hypothetical protein
MATPVRLSVAHAGQPKIDDKGLIHRLCSLQLKNNADTMAC